MAKNHSTKSFSAYNDMIEKVYGRWTVLKIIPLRHSRLECLCACGKKGTPLASDVKCGISRSCGCVKKIRLTTHGMSHWPEHQIWRNMLQRCYNPKNDAYFLYGGKGITVCEQWRDSFENFINDMGRRPPKHSIERKNGCKGYSPDNCEWVTQDVQMRNTSRTRNITWDGRTMCMTDWAKEMQMCITTLDLRLKNWSLERAMTEPVNVNYRPKHLQSISAI